MISGKKLCLPAFISYFILIRLLERSPEVIILSLNVMKMTSRHLKLASCDDEYVILQTDDLLRGKKDIIMTSSYKDDKIYINCSKTLPKNYIAVTEGLRHHPHADKHASQSFVCIIVEYDVNLKALKTLLLSPFSCSSPMTETTVRLNRKT